ncbi:YncE family protein [Nocardia alni]|uniref:YVTN family beta-propeller repeat protein n=1 Tax=Nocardia alni TaxID=2815723 RepID=UPI001C21098A|nr:YncE family protein [Nocardia alni]
MRVRRATLGCVGAAIVLAGCVSSGIPEKLRIAPHKPRIAQVLLAPAPVPPPMLPGMPPPLSPTDVYAGARQLAPSVAGDLPRVYVPNSGSNTISVIDPATYQVIDTYPSQGEEPQHVVPSYDMRMLYATNDLPIGSGSLLPIDPRTGKPGDPLPVRDPYNMYFTPDGRYAMVVAEADKSLDLYDPHDWRRVGAIPVPECAGVDHMDFTADGRHALISCEFAGRMGVVDIARQRLVGMIDLPDGREGMPQDVKLSPDGATFFVADMMADGVYTIDARTFQVTGFVPTGKGTHGLYVTRDAARMIITNRGEGSLSVWDFAQRKVVRTWAIPGGGSPDMGNISADGRVFWVSGRYSGEVYAIDIVDWKLLARIPVGRAPHGLTIWPQPGRYSTGHTGVMR